MLSSFINSQETDKKFTSSVTSVASDSFCLFFFLSGLLVVVKIMTDNSQKCSFELHHPYVIERCTFQCQPEKNFFQSFLVVVKLIIDAIVS